MAPYTGTNTVDDLKSSPITQHSESFTEQSIVCSKANFDYLSDLLVIVGSKERDKVNLVSLSATSSILKT